MDFPIPFSGSANFKGKTSIWNVYFRKCKKCFGCCNNSEEILKQHIIHSFSVKRHQHICLSINSLEYILNMFFLYFDEEICLFVAIYRCRERQIYNRYNYSILKHSLLLYRNTQKCNKLPQKLLL